MAKWWEDKAWRMIQTNLREIDMLDISAEQFVRDLQEFKATAVMFNTAGIIASYPTDLDFHFQSPFLTGDSVGDIIDACHKAGIRFVGRNDFSKIRRPIFEQHPDWAYRTASGEIVDYNGDVHACVMGDYQQIYALKILEELLTRYDLDGIFFNMSGFQTRDYSHNYYGPCHCDACKKAFGEMFGLPIPTVEDMDDPAYRKYTLFKERAIAAYHARVVDTILSLRPDIAIANHPNAGGGFIRQESNTAVDRPLPHWQYNASSNTKWAVGTHPGMISSNTTVDFIDIDYRHVTVSPSQQELRLAQNLANGGQLDWYLIGRIDNHEDRSGFAPVKRMFHYHAAHESDYVGNRSLANVLLLNDSRSGTPECRGWFRVLVENHFLFDAPLVSTALEQNWDQYDLLILPDIRYVSDELAKKIDDFVAGGGTVLASFKSGMFDAEYEARSEPAFKSLGVRKVEWVRDDMRSAYFKLGEHPDFPRLSETDLIYMDGPYIYAKYGAKSEEHFRLIPPHNFGPPERCYYEVVVDRPAYTVTEHGKGRAIYVPWLPGELFHRQGHVNTANFMADLIQQVAGVEPVGGNAPEQVEVTVLENKAGFRLVHLVNTSGHFGTSFYEPVTMHDLEVTVSADGPAACAEGLVSGQPIDHSYSDGKLTLRIPRLGLFEAVKLSW